MYNIKYNSKYFETNVSKKNDKENVGNPFQTVLSNTLWFYKVFFLVAKCFLSEITTKKVLHLFWLIKQKWNTLKIDKRELFIYE